LEIGHVNGICAKLGLEIVTFEPGKLHLKSVYGTAFASDSEWYRRVHCDSDWFEEEEEERFDWDSSSTSTGSSI
jgi:hypothetical protein